MKLNNHNYILLDNNKRTGIKKKFTGQSMKEAQFQIYLD